MRNSEFNYKKYVKPDFQPKNFTNREWPDKDITKAPIWCSVDLRDGNQSLPTPMSLDEKMGMFKMLLDVGFKEIEIGFPSASQTEYDFLRKLIDENLIPDDVKVQVLTQSREHLITKTFEALKGCKNRVFTSFFSDLKYPWAKAFSRFIDSYSTNFDIYVPIFRHFCTFADF
mgnify:CR=1 FL=1